MNVTFIVTSYWAYGELLISLEFAKRIKQYGYIPYFFIPPSHEHILVKEGMDYTMLIPKCGNINRILFKDHEIKVSPDFIILSDFLNYNFCEDHYGLRQEDLKIFSGRLGTFDNFDWNIEKRNMDTYGFPASIASKVKVEDYGFRLVPCPIGNSRLQNGDDKFYYPLFEHYIDYNKQENTYAKQKLNIALDKPMILLTSATWQETYKKYKKVVDFVNEVNNKFCDIILKISQYANVVCIGSKNSFGIKPSENVMLLESVAPMEFEQYIKACDAFVSLNLTSTTLAKVACSGVPSLVLVHNENKKSESELGYPYRMFPVGWYYFLEPLCTNNIYTELLEQEDVFETEKVIDILKKMIFDKEYLEKVQMKAKEYRDGLNGLMKPEEILTQLRKN